MKLRTSFVTNSSSSSFVIFGKTREHLLKTIVEKKIFGELSKSIVDSLKGERVLVGKKLKEFYENNILYTMNKGREDALNALVSDDPYKWMYSASISRRISKQAGLIHDTYLDSRVAFIIELEDVCGSESFGWNAVGFHNAGTRDFNEVILVIGINGH